MKPLDADDEIVESELIRFWLNPGERLLLGCAPIRGYVGARIGTDLRIPHEPLSEVPPLDLGRSRWPLPSTATTEQDWTDDPVLGYWAIASHPSTAAIRLADHFAHSRGEARLAVSTHRVAVVYPTKLFQPSHPSTVFTTYAETPITHLVGIDAPYAGHSLPSPRVIRLVFADSSVLLLRDSYPAVRVQRAHNRR